MEERQRLFPLSLERIGNDSFTLPIRVMQNDSWRVSWASVSSLLFNVYPASFNVVILFFRFSFTHSNRQREMRGFSYEDLQHIASYSCYLSALLPGLIVRLLTSSLLPSSFTRTLRFIDFSLLDFSFLELAHLLPSF